MKPEKNSNTVLAITRSKGKMYKYYYLCGLSGSSMVLANNLDLPYPRIGNFL